MRLKRNFFNRDTVVVARELLGKLLVRKIGKKIIKARIIETEAYCGVKDLACHASKGLTERTKVMFGPAGFSYVYMIYGMYHCLNIVTERKGNPSAVLIRAAVVDNRLAKSVIHIEVVNGLPRSELPTLFSAVQPQSEVLLRGPGKLCRELKIDRKLNAVDLTKSNLLWIEDSKIKIKKNQIKKGKRIGVDYAGKWKDKLWRFYVNDDATTNDE